MGNIGVFGGTFNPIHSGHLAFCSGIADQLALEQVILMPAKVPPHKSAPDLAPAADRLAMCRLAAGTDPRLQVSGWELGQPGKSYTVLTLRALSALYPDSALWLLMGSDMFFTVQDWYRADEIFSLCRIVASAREEGEWAQMQSHLSWLRARGVRAEVILRPVLAVSSTEIRARLAAGDDVDGLVPHPVAAYIRARGLYGARPKEGDTL